MKRVTCVLALLTLLAGGGLVRSVPVHGGQWEGALFPSWSSPTMWIENVGQFDPCVRFQAHIGLDTLWLGKDAIWVMLAERPTPSLSPGSMDHPFSPFTQQKGEGAEGRREARRAVALRLSFVGANPRLRPEPFDRLETSANYFIGNDPANWHTGVPIWGGVRYTSLYPGVDLVVGAGLAPAQRQGSPLPWHLEVHDGADLSAVRLRVEGAEEAVVEQGHLLLTTAVGEFALPLPGTPPVDLPHPQVQRTAARAFEIAAPFAGRSAGLTPPQHLVAQGTSPILAYATNLGGSFDDQGRDVAVDGAGNAYVVGTTRSPDFPTTPGVPGEFYHGGDYDVFVAKMNPSGTNLEFATFLGGVGDDWGDDFGCGVAVDGSGNVYVTGWTDSRAFPVTDGAYDTTYNGGIYDAFAARLNSTGSALLYATFLGGEDQEKGVDVETDSAGNAYLTGWTASVDFPSAAASTGFDVFHGGDTDVFVAKLNPSGSALEYALLVGGSDLEIGAALAVDTGGYAHVTGWTESTDFPWRLASDYTLGGDVDAFVACVRPSGGNLFFSTYLGGSHDEIGWDIAVDGEGHTYVVGTTNSTDLPVTAGAFDTSYNGGYSDAFVAKLSASTLHYATYLGDDSSEQGYGLAVDTAGSVYVTGTLGDDTITKLDSTGSSVSWRFTVAGFNESDDIAMDTWGGVYVLGHDYSDVWLAKVASPEQISGRVMDSSGQPLVGIQVSAGSVFSATTDTSGQYTLTVPAGSHTFAPTSPGYFWSPASRSATIPPDVTGQDFIGKSVAKDVMPGSAQAVDYGDVLTYTVHLVAPENRSVALYDPVPIYTTFISGSLNGPSGVIYDPAGDAVSGTLALTYNVPLTITFQVRVAITGTAGSAPFIVNRACAHPPGSDLAACEWSNETTNPTYLSLVYLPLINR